MQQYSLNEAYIQLLIQILFTGVQVATLGASFFTFVTWEVPSIVFKFIVANPNLTPSVHGLFYIGIFT